MKNTLWLSNSEIDKLTFMLSSDFPNDNIASSILKELGVAKARASSNRLLNSPFKSIIGKTKNEVPVKLTSDEYNFLSDKNIINKSGE